VKTQEFSTYSNLRGLAPEAEHIDFVSVLGHMLGYEQAFTQALASVT